jgi:uncharacterized protein (TIGR02246 family)
MRPFIMATALLSSGLIGAVVLAQPKPPAPPGAPKAPAAPGTPQKPAAPRMSAPGPAPAGPAATTQPASSKQPSLSAPHAADDQAIRQTAAAVSKAYNAGDAKAIAAMFTQDAVIVDEDENNSQGRDAIEGIFADIFKEHPKAHMDISIESILFPSPLMAIEEGRSTVLLEADEPPQTSRYTVIHVKQDGKWLMASARDLTDPESAASRELEQLAWLIGKWVDESPEGLVKANYDWTDNHMFIVSDFVVHIGGRPAVSGTQRIGWDPLAKQLHSWIFDSQGGFAEGLWTRQDNQWIVKLSGVSRDGRVGSATQTITRLAGHKYLFESRDRLVGQEVIEDTPAVTVVRLPPGPKD